MPAGFTALLLVGAGGLREAESNWAAPQASTRATASPEWLAAIRRWPSETRGALEDF